MWGVAALKKRSAGPWRHTHSDAGAAKMLQPEHWAGFFAKYESGQNGDEQCTNGHHMNITWSH
jgi:hypothetical protein